MYNHIDVTKEYIRIKRGIGGKCIVRLGNKRNMFIFARCRTAGDGCS